MFDMAFSGKKGIVSKFHEIFSNLADDRILSLVSFDDTVERIMKSKKFIASVVGKDEDVSHLMQSGKNPFKSIDGIEMHQVPSSLCLPYNTRSRINISFSLSLFDEFDACCAGDLVEKYCPGNKNIKSMIEANYEDGLDVHVAYGISKVLRSILLLEPRQCGCFAWLYNASALGNDSMSMLANSICLKTAIDEEKSKQRKTSDQFMSSWLWANAFMHPYNPLNSVISHACNNLAINLPVASSMEEMCMLQLFCETVLMEDEVAFREKELAKHKKLLADSLSLHEKVMVSYDMLSFSS